MFSWDISPYCQVETDPDKTSEVEVRFTALADQGWPLYLARYADLLTS